MRCIAAASPILEIHHKRSPSVGHVRSLVECERFMCVYNGQYVDTIREWGLDQLGPPLQ
jgi:hypothetical protein